MTVQLRLDRASPRARRHAADRAGCEDRGGCRASRKWSHEQCSEESPDEPAPGRTFAGRLAVALVDEQPAVSSR